MKLLTHEKIKKMVTYFNKKDLVKFGHYLLSEERETSIISGTTEDNLGTLKNRLRQVSDADIENFKKTLKKED